MTICENCEQPIVLVFRTWTHLDSGDVQCGLQEQPRWRATPALLDLDALAALEPASLDS